MVLGLPGLHSAFPLWHQATAASSCIGAPAEGLFVIDLGWMD
jgi:hypothetical protein